VISLNEKTKAEYKAMGIEVRSGTQEEADSLGILINFGNPLDKPKTEYAGQPEPAGQREDEIVPTKRKVVEGSILANVTKMQYFNS